MKILITGANGQLGRELHLLSVLNPQHIYYFTDINELDITNEEALLHYVNKCGAQLIINCAAFTAVDAAEDQAELCDLLNHKAVGYLAKAASSNNAKLIQISTDYVFDGHSYRPYTETDETFPSSVYGSTKLAGEKAALQNCHDTMIIRTSWLYSQYGNNFVKTMLRLGKERESINVIFDQIGTPTFAGDLALLIFEIIDKGINRGIYHYSNEGVCSWYDFAVAIHRIANITDCRINAIHTADYPGRAHRPFYAVLDKSRIKADYKVDIPHWEESLTRCIVQLT